MNIYKERIKQYMKRHNISQADLAVSLGIKPPTVSIFLNNDKPAKEKTLLKYIRAVNHLGGPGIAFHPDKLKGNQIEFKKRTMFSEVENKIKEKEKLKEKLKEKQKKKQKEKLKETKKEKINSGKFIEMEAINDKFKSIDKKLTKLTETIPPDNDFALAKAISVLSHIKEEIEKGIKNIGKMLNS
jgi:transcriptional regulator with XRE-family HTH domain